MIVPVSGVLFQYGSPQSSLVRLQTKISDSPKEIHPALNSKKIRFSYSFPQVFLNFSKIIPERIDFEGNSTMGKNRSFNGNSSLDNPRPPIKFKIIISQNYFQLSIASKCGVGVFESIPKTGNFEHLNNYYKEFYPAFNDSFSDMNESNSEGDPQNNMMKNHSDHRNGTHERSLNDSSELLQNKSDSNDSLENNTIPSRNDEDNNETSSFLPKNSKTEENSTEISQIAENSTVYEEISNREFKPFTIYENGSYLNLLLNLDSKDYFFITVVGYVESHNDTYFFYDPILIKDSHLTQDGLMDFGIILISKINNSI